MNRRDAFLGFVFSGAIARDLVNDTHEAQLIARIAADIPATKIPPCPVNAAKVFLEYCYSIENKPWRWMRGEGADWLDV